MALLWGPLVDEPIDVNCLSWHKVRGEGTGGKFVSHSLLSGHQCKIPVWYPVGFAQHSFLPTVALSAVSAVLMPAEHKVLTVPITSDLPITSIVIPKPEESAGKRGRIFRQTPWGSRGLRTNARLFKTSTHSPSIDGTSVILYSSDVNPEAFPSSS